MRVIGKLALLGHAFTMFDIMLRNQHSTYDIKKSEFLSSFDLIGQDKFFN